MINAMDAGNAVAVNGNGAKHHVRTDDVGGKRSLDFNELLKKLRPSGKRPRPRRCTWPVAGPAALEKILNAALKKYASSHQRRKSESPGPSKFKN